MDFTPQGFMSFSSAIEEVNEVSAFKVKFFQSGSFAQITNSTGKVHDLSFQAILQSLIDIQNTKNCQDYIQYCFENPTLVKAVESEEKERHDQFVADLGQGNLIVNELSNFKYFEKSLRVIGKEYLTDERAQVVAAEQTKLFFNIISRFVHIANGVAQTRELDTQMPFSRDELTKTISYISGLVSFCTVDSGASSFSGFGVTSSSLAENTIYYGAPGTGKSHAIDVLTASAKKVVTVFHPDTQHSDFVGALKPTMDAGNITYQFRPGPFTKALIAALNHPDTPVYLVIEEINRAPAAAVFGELFQLLDRKDGASKYKIDAADPDMLAYINSKLSTGVSSISKLAIPANLSLLATMNSSDQAVMPLDTAFKRRWSFRYMKIDFEHADVSDQQFTVMTLEGLYKISWRNFAEKVINHLLKELRIPEDRLLGPFFLSTNELGDESAANEALCGKLFVYLWDDVLRHKRNGVIFDDGITTFGELHDRFMSQSLSVFGVSADALIIQNGIAVNAETPVTEEDGVDA